MTSTFLPLFNLNVPNAVQQETAWWHLAARMEAAKAGYECLMEMIIPVGKKTYGILMGGIVAGMWWWCRTEAHNEQ